MSDNAKTWFFDLFLPVAHYRIAPHISYKAFKNKIFLQQLDNRTLLVSDIVCCDPFYALCYSTDFYDVHNDIRYQFTFSISAIYSLKEIIVGFHANTRKKSYAAFAYDFSVKQMDKFCRLSDIELPDVAFVEIKNQILYREDNEALRLGLFTILNEKESLEEVLIERDLTCCELKRCTI